MAKRGRRKLTLNATAENVGAALGRLASRLHAWKQQRVEIAGEIGRLVEVGQRMLKDLGQTASKAARKTGGKPGRPAGFKMSPAARKKMRDAWKRRKAEAAAAKAQK